MMTDEWPLVDVQLLDGDHVEVAIWTGYMVPPLDHLPNVNVMFPYMLLIDGRDYIKLRPGPLDGVVWQALIEYAKEFTE